MTFGTPAAGVGEHRCGREGIGMTERKGLKRLVRERMARTGESYTTARRQVLARANRITADRLPPGLVPGYDTFGVESHRESALIVHVLKSMNVEYTESMIAGLAGGIGFMYFVFDYTGLPPMLTIVAQHHPEPWAAAAFGRLSVPVAEAHSSSTTAALKKLVKELDAGRPVLCAVDRSRLPWHGMLPGYGQDPYLVVVAGRDGDDLLIDDQAGQPARLGTEEFGQAWAAHKKGRHHMMVPGGPPPDLDLAAAARQAIKGTSAHLTGPVLGNNFDVNFGFSGMSKLSDQLRDRKSKTGWATRFGAPVPFFHGMRRLYECLEVELTAPAATRPVYAAFLDEAADLLAGPELTEAAGLFRRSGQTWSRLATRAMETADSLRGYGELAEQRLELMCAGAGAPEELRRIDERVEELASAYAAEDPLGDQGRLELFDELATLVDEARTAEQDAIAILAKG
jgi:hypothetical protein